MALAKRAANLGELVAQTTRPRELTAADEAGAPCVDIQTSLRESDDPGAALFAYSGRYLSAQTA